MPTTIVVGGQFGSEGKGKVVALLAKELDEPWVVRCGGPNSGHTLTVNSQNIVLRQIPASANHEGATLLLAAGCVIDEEVLLSELEAFSIPRERIVVDPRAVLVDEKDRNEERASLAQIGSTFSGTGAALVRRMKRTPDVRLASNSRILQQRCRLEVVASLLHKRLESAGHVIVEGTQGLGLSLLHGPYYPYVTSRDTTASAFAMEVGLSPRQIDSIVMVIRTFPIRVGGESGPLPQEITWEDVQRISGAPSPVYEHTSVTNRLRRVARFDMEAVKTACRYNQPTSLAVMGLDRLDHANSGVTSFSQLTQGVRSFIQSLEEETGVPVHMLGTGFSTYEAVRLPIAMSIPEFVGG